MTSNSFDTGAENPYASPPSLPAEAAGVAGDEDMQPFKTIWFRPRQTIRRIVATDPSQRVLLLCSLTGIGEWLDRASLRSLGDTMSTGAIIGSAVLFGPLVGILSLWISSYLLKLAGTWMGGSATPEQIRAAVAWASVPSVFALLLWIPQFLILGPDTFTEESPRLDAQPALLIPFFAVVIAEFVLGVWSVILACNTVAEVQGYQSAWRGFGNFILAGVVVLVPLLVIALGILYVTRF